MTKQEIQEAKCPNCGSEKRIVSILHGCVNRYICECYNNSCCGSKYKSRNLRRRNVFILNEYPIDENGNYFMLYNMRGFQKNDH